MSSGSVPHAAGQPHPDGYASFVADACNNATLVREVFGPQSMQYQRLVAHYHLTADKLGCRARLEQALARTAT
jgi:hypothetical protein